ncbi:MAG: CHAT domain-containing protein, partial [Chloroflexota bacterium]
SVGYFSKVLDLYKDKDLRNNSPKMVSSTLSNIAIAYEMADQPDQAVGAYEQTLNIIEAIRATTSTDQARSLFADQYAAIYHHVIAYLYQQDRPETLFFTLERNRARTFLDSLSTQQVSFNNDEITALFILENRLYSEQLALRDAIRQSKDLTSPNSPQTKELEAQLATVEVNYQETRSAIEAHDNRLVSLILGRSLQNVISISAVQDNLDAHTGLLSYYVFDSLSLVILVTSDSLEIVSLDFSRAEIEQQVSFLRNAVDLRDSTLVAAATEVMHQRLIPEQLKTQDLSRLIIVPHGPLHYVPFAALKDAVTNKYLLENYELVYLPSASTLPFVKTDTPLVAAKSPLIIGNPTLPNVNFTPLPFAALEAEIIADQYNTTPILGLDATEQAVRQRIAEADVVHFAAHGAYNPQTPLNSAIYFAPDETHDGALTVGEVYGLDLTQANLVVLSACQTQLGDLSAGDDVIGLTRAFFFAGSPTVVASLWNVNDEATGMLMVRFYQYLDNGLSKAAALRQAQLDMLKQPQLAEPFFWSAFVMSGDGGVVRGNEGQPSPQSNVNSAGDAAQTPAPKVDSVTVTKSNASDNRSELDEPTVFGNNQSPLIFGLVGLFVFVGLAIFTLWWRKK